MSAGSSDEHNPAENVTFDRVLIEKSDLQTPLVSNVEYGYKKTFNWDNLRPELFLI